MVFLKVNLIVCDGGVNYTYIIILRILFIMTIIVLPIAVNFMIYLLCRRNSIHRVGFRRNPLTAAAGHRQTPDRDLNRTRLVIWKQTVAGRRQIRAEKRETETIMKRCTRVSWRNGPWCCTVPGNRRTANCPSEIRIPN